MALALPFDRFLKSPIMMGISKETERKLRGDARPVELAPRDRMPADVISFLARGHAKFVALLPNGQEHAAAFLWPGALVVHAPERGGELAALDHCSIVAFPPERFLEIISGDRAAAHNVARAQAQRVDELRRHGAMLARLNAREKIVTFLNQLAQKNGVVEAESVKLRLPMSRAEIADHLGLTIETTSRCMTELKRSGLISCPSRREVVLLSKSGIGP